MGSLLKLEEMCGLYGLGRSQYIELFLNFIRKAGSEYEWHKEKEKEQDSLTQDILHCLELEEMGYHERARLGKYLSDVRKERRKHKDALEELEPVIQFIDGNRKAIKAMEQMLGAVRKQEKYHENRSYHPKILKRKEDRAHEED